jgi:hypothetical protein
MSNPLLRYVLPTLLVGALGGYFAGATLGASGKVSAGGKSGQRATPRSDFLSSDDDEVDYEKLARVCLAAANRGVPQTSSQASIIAEPNSPAVRKVKAKLDEVMSISLEDGVWSRGASMRAQNLLRLLPASDVADFEKLLLTTLERGDLKPQPGAWIPEAIN